MTPGLDLATLPTLLTLPELAGVLRRGVGSIRRELEAGTFVPAPWARDPYRWRKVDVERWLSRPGPVGVQPRARRGRKPSRPSLVRSA